MTQKQVKKEMSAVGLEWLETKSILPQQHILVLKSRTLPPDFKQNLYKNMVS
jgi:hypothetical protein